MPNCALREDIHNLTESIRKFRQIEMELDSKGLSGCKHHLGRAAALAAVVVEHLRCVALDMEGTDECNQ